MTHEITPDQLKRLSTDWALIAKENIEIEITKGVIYAFGSELACLRLGLSFNTLLISGKAKVLYSVNLQSWCFRLET